MNKLIGAIVVIVVLVVTLGLVLSFPLMLLWNGCLVPAVNGLNEVSWLQMWGISVLIGLMFKSSTSSKE